MTNTKWILVAIAALVIGFVGGVIGTQQNVSLGSTSYDVSNLIGDVYQGMSHTQEFTNGNFVGPILTSQTVSVSGVTHVGDFTEGGSIVNLTTTSTLTAAQICSASQIIVANTTATITLTLPAATATVGVANCLTTNGDFFRFMVINNSTNTVNFATSTGDTISKPFNSSGTTSLSIATGPNPVGSFTLTRLTATTTQYLFLQYGPGL